jgi:hypothetical protein
MLLGEDGTAYLAGSSSPDGPVDTVSSLDPTTGIPNWSAPVSNPTLNTVLSDGGILVETGSSGLVQLDNTGTVVQSLGSLGSPSRAQADNTGTVVQPRGKPSSALSILQPLDSPSSALSSAVVCITGCTNSGSIAGVISGSFVAVSASLSSGVAAGPYSQTTGGTDAHKGEEPGLVLVATQDCHRVNSDQTIFARYPTYRLRASANLTQELDCAHGQCYTVFEYLKQRPSSCSVGGIVGLAPCTYADGGWVPYNEFGDEISAKNASPFDLTQSFYYGIPGQRPWPVKNIYSTFSGSPRLKQPSDSNQLHAVPAADPLIDGHLDPWLAPWDGNAASCNACPKGIFCNQ